MELIHDPEEMRQRAQDWKSEGKTIALVPTMGAFHEGHLSLMREGRKRADVLVVSLFVNPTQFAPNEDVDRYPRNLRRDRELADTIGVDLMFVPEQEAMYPPEYKTYVVVEDMSEQLCGSSRPTHFRGVTTVVLKLFHIAQPDLAIFGWKDAQQFLILKRMVEDLHLPVKIIALPIVREPDGLAMSSRNAYLNQTERRDARVLWKALSKAQKMIRDGEKDSDILRDEIERSIRSANSSKIDYIDIVSINTLEPLGEIDPANTLIALAVFIGSTRLIDNIRV